MSEQNTALPPGTPAPDFTLRSTPDQTVTLSDLPSEISYRELLEETFSVGSAKITTHYLNHTSICMGYRIEANGRSVAYVSDHEPYGLALFGADPPAEPIGRGLRDGVVHVGDQAGALVHRDRQRLGPAHAAAAGGDAEPAGEGPPKVLPAALGEGLVGALQDALCADVDP